MGSASAIAPDLKAECLPVAVKVFWWCTPEEGLQDLTRFVAQVMTFGDWEDVRRTMGILGEKAFEAVLDDPPPGVFDRKSWNYWHLFFRRTSLPPLPRREL